MNKLQGSNDVEPPKPVIAQEHGPNTELIKDAIPDWLIKTSLQRRAVLRGVSAKIPSWYNTASLEQRKEMKRLTEASIISQTVLDTVMASVTDISTFAEPLLRKALADTHNIHLDVHKVCLRLRKSTTLGVLGIEMSTYTVMTLSLLDAALHNFEAFECEAGAFHASSGFVTQNADGTYDSLTTTLSVKKFTTLCRELDIGQLYQNHIKSMLLPGDAVAQAMLSRKFIACQKDALQAAAYMALVKNDIELNDYNIILKVIAGEQNIMNGNAPVWFWEPVVLGQLLTGCMVFATVEKYKYGVDEAILYIPHDPEHPVKKYRMSPQPELTRQLLATATSPGKAGQATDYQRFLSQFIDYKDHPKFFSGFTQKIADAPFDSLSLLRPPIVSQYLLPALLGPIGSQVTPNTLPPETPTPREPVTELNIHLTYRNREGLWAENGDPWAQLFQRSRDKILSDARSHAVPTADADAKTRADKIAHWLEAGMAVLNVVSMFVPVLGEVMLGVMAGQLMYETLEGTIEWSEGDREAAWAHLIDVAENLALMGVMAGGGRILKGVHASSFVDGLKPVQLPSGETRLWKPDLAPYQANIDLPTGSVPDELGLHTVEGQQVLSLDNQPYVVKQDPATGEYRIQHPARADAYAPLLEHNGEGGWVHEGEEPSTWDGPILMRRLGYRTEAFSDAQLEQVRITSGIEGDQLRRLHVEQQRPAAQLTDTLTRFRIDRDIETFREQIGSDDPAVYAKADLRMQFRVMRSQELLPATPSIKVLDNKAKLIWEDPVAQTEQSRRLTFVVSDQDAAKGSVLTSLLEMFKAQQVDIDSVPGASDLTLDLRAAELRKEIARTVQNSKHTLVESLYKEQDANVDRSVNRIKAFFPQLPSIVVEQILEGATQEDLLALGESGPLPHGIYEPAERARQELRVAHAYEGLYLETSSGIDSERLALRSLEALPGWPKDVRFELREYGARGKLLDAIGAPQKPTRAVLVVDENTRFAQSSSANLYLAVLQAMTSEERQALGFTLREAERLKLTVQQTPLPRDQFREVLQKHRLLRPSVEPGMKLLGGVGPSQVMNLFRTPQTRVLKLYPDFSEAEVETFLHSLGDDVRGGLTQREAEYATLKKELKTWVQARVTAESSPDVAGQVAGRRERQIANELKRCWQRQSGSTLSIDSTVELPSLSARFNHVEMLALTGTGVRNLNTFLKSFTGLKTLRLEEMSRLNVLPEAVGEMKGLIQLSLRGSGIRFDEHNAAMFGKLSALEELDLLKNPLGIPPDFSTMTRLRKINLSSTSIDQWPAGMANLPDLQMLDLRENELTEVPQALLSMTDDQLEVNARVIRVTLLEDNPFTRQSWQRLNAYREQLQALRPDLLEGSLPGAFKVQDSMSARVRQLYPGFDEFEVAEFLQTHGSTAEVELVRLEREYERLNQQLSAWAFSGGGAHQRYVRAGQFPVDLSDRAERYMAVDRIRECWRRQSPQRNAVDGSPIGFELDLSGQTLDSVPDLEADFSHVGSLKLSGMGLSVSPEGFLAHFRGVRWLDLSGNQLTAIPPALGEMNGLTRLFLQRNRIRLTPETAQLLGGRTTLRALTLSFNPLGMTLDFSRITDMRSLGLESCNIDTWPIGLGEQPLLDGINLRNNRITTIPESVIAPPVEQLERMARVNNITQIQGNPFSEAAQQQLRNYWSRLERERPDLWAARRPGVFEFRAPGSLLPERVQLQTQGQTAFTRWTKDLPADQLSTRETQWQALYAQDGARGFFQVLNDLENAGAGHDDLQIRVWEVIDTITESTPESEALRGEMFEWAGRPACCDRAALSFSNLEIMALVYRARTLAMDGEQSVALLKLSRGLFRLDEVEKIALADIDRRTAAIHQTPGLSTAEQARRISSLEDVEIKLAYRIGLKDRLGLPGQPRQARFISLGNVTLAMLDRAYAKVVALDNSPAEFQSLVAKDFWNDFVTNKYRPQFEAKREPYQDRLASLRESQQAGGLSEPQYKTQSEDLDAQLQIEEAALIDKLTREELAKNPL